MKHRIYEIIKDNPNRYSSIDLGNILGITPDDVRAYIREINNDLSFDIGIISIKHKYKLANEANDFKQKVLYYRNKHKELLRMEKLWLQRQDKWTSSK